jgi:cysteine desulfurase
VSPITENTPSFRDFQNDLPLHPAARDLLAYFFDSGWVDPTKLHHQSAHLRNLIGTARETIASNLGIKNSELEVVGELGFGFQIALGGLLTDSSVKFFYAEIDRQVVHACARSHINSGGSATPLKPSTLGMVDYQNALAPEKASVISWQSTNREMGAMQELPQLDETHSLFADMTASFPLNRLPERWDTALWDPRSFAGPQGIALIGISQQSKWRNPGPKIDNRRVFGSFSKPLLLATAVALENWVKGAEEDFARLKKLNTYTRDLLRSRINSVRVVGDDQRNDPRFIALVLDNSIAEEVLRKVERAGFLIDAGSACGAGALSPSHVLTSMGLPENGNLRLTLKPEQNESVITELVERIAASA